MKLGYRPANYGYSAETHEFVALNWAIYFAYVRQIGAGAVAAGGFITLLKTIPTIVSSFRGSLRQPARRGEAGLPTQAHRARSAALVRAAPGASRSS